MKIETNISINWRLTNNLRHFALKVYADSRRVILRNMRIVRRCTRIISGMAVPLERAFPQQILLNLHRYKITS